MANEEHLALLKQGADTWNEWRKQNRDIRPDLRGAHLTLAHLSGADLSGADLSGADLSGADLTGANLTGASLVAALLMDAVLSGADLSVALLGETVFANNDLSNTKRLDAYRHRGPSVIDIRTLGRSGPLPLAFLRGAGLPDNLIDYRPSLLNQAIQFYSCFISYSCKDDDFARRLHADLQAEGVRCWFAPEDMKIGDRIRDRSIKRFGTGTSCLWSCPSTPSAARGSRRRSRRPWRRSAAARTGAPCCSP